MYDSGEYTYWITLKDGLRIFSESEEFRNVLETGLFYCYVERSESGNLNVDRNGDVWCCYVINHEKYISKGEDDKTWLTDYAKNNLSECALRFTLKE